MPEAGKARATKSHAHPKPDLPPDERVLTRRQAEYLAETTQLELRQLEGRRLRELDELLKFRIDPTLLFFRKVCGRVVRKDPLTGILYGVPNATVYVEDTDCSFLGFFPVEHPWWWLWPIVCHREVIATAHTDACGNFCVFIPRWDIDRILRLRRKRICYPDIFRPSIRDLIPELVLRPRPVDPNPPDPPPFNPDIIERIAQIAALGGPDTAQSVLRLRAGASFGDDISVLEDVLDRPAFAEPLPPPLSEEAVKRLEQIELAPGRDEAAKAPTAAGLTSILAERVLGPFIRCHDIIVAEWQTIVDIPDITFRVEQDTDGDGDEEVIHSESFFDVRWNAGYIGPVTLYANASALISHVCQGPSIPCVNVPSINTVGLMPLIATHHNNGTGYATRVNRPRPLGLSSNAQVSPGQAPYAGTLQLHGCHHITNGVFYRLLYSFNGNAEVPFLGLEWYAPRLGGGAPIHFVPDNQGWYPIVPAAQLVFPHWLLNWPTSAGGTYDIRLQIGDGAKNPVGAPSAVVKMRIDNSPPNVGFVELRWRPVGGAYLPQNTYFSPFTCIVIQRPPVDIEVEVRWFASATHFRNAFLSGSGCGGGNPVPQPPPSNFDHWHQNFGDNAVFRIASFVVPAGVPQGAYGFRVDAWGRAFNAAGDGGGPATNWLTNYNYSYNAVHLPVAIIDA
jgi:hypothetical protein